MSRGFLLIDGPNIGNAVNASQPLRVGDQATQAVYNFMRVMRSMVSVYSMLTPVVLWDGASWRKMKFAEYKAKRDRAETKAEIEALRAKEEFKSQVPLIREGLRYLGVKQMFAMNYEADDLAGMLVERYAAEARKVVMISADKDWVQLLQPNAIWIDPVRDYRLSVTTIKDRLGWHPEKKKIGVYKGDQVAGWIGVPHPRAWLEMKCLMGDISDNIPGVGKIGPKGAIDLVTTYGSVGSFIMQVIDKTIDPATLPANLRNFAEQEEKQDIFRRNMQLMDLRSPERPVWVNPSIDKGEFDPAKFEAFCRKWAFNSIVTAPTWTEPFNPEMKALAA